MKLSSTLPISIVAGLYILQTIPVWSAEDTVILKEQQPNITINFLGDIILGRTVAMRVAQNGVSYPFASMAAITRDASMTVADLECPLSDRYPPVYKNTMDFISPRRAAEGLAYAGIDLVALANNHSTNYGREVFADTLETLRDHQIAYVGGGRNLEEARSLKVITINGVKFGFLNYNSISGSFNATGKKAGVNFVHLKPSDQEDHPEDIARMLTDIQKAREQCDVLTVILHWGEEYKPPIPTQISLAHQLVDDGADIIIGTHPHIAQPVEIYKGKVIAYSLGNFVFDQMQSDETRDGYILRVSFAHAELAGVQVIPYRIYDFAQPRPSQDKSLVRRVLYPEDQNADTGKKVHAEK